MDFFERQRQVRAASNRMVLLFVLAVLTITAVANLAVMPFVLPEQRVGTAILVSIGVLTLISGVSVVKTLTLRQGGGTKVAESLGGVRVPDMPADPKLQRYRNIVEEVAIASSTPVPVLYYLPQEQAINAFAAGYTPADAAICVTQGSLDRLNRDELQGVIAHEFSHIVNGDMRLSLKLIGVVSGIIALAVVGRVLAGTRGGSSRDRGGAPLLMLGVVLYLVGWIGVFFGRLIKAAVSRQREYLADASAVQFTRQTAGLTGALKKIGGLPAGSQLNSPRTEDVSHMLFGPGLRISSLFATHPPLLERIQVLEPGFNPAELEQLRRHWQVQPADGMAEDARSMGLAAAPAAARARAPWPPPTQPSGRPDYAATVGNPTAASYQAGAQLRDAIPPKLAQWAHDRVTAVPLIYALIFDRNENIRRTQHQIVARAHGRQLADQAWSCGAELASLDPRLRLPLASIAFPALRAHPQPEQQRLMAVVGELINADGRLDVFEYCLGTLIFVGLSESTGSTSPWRSRRQSLASARTAVCHLLAVLAQTGNTDPAAAAAAFRAGIAVAYPGEAIPLLPTDGVRGLEQVWPVIDGLVGADKARVVNAAVTTVTADGVVTVAESELLRTVCAVLHCPVPPVT
ncbi:M48 family metallopeptidase [Mycolicibacillus trivialis]|uniref:Peptidase M48 n=1 Tax=Mycolicibacillus trivialis TaxID=1798 RepID=A0A1X2EKZ2_9MYCO|nr:M48 family metallopeptidase [Mycolicibacillus trivialis]ORX05687.1 peptidase M48 [Mycolicibacillus trivialis]